MRVGRLVKISLSGFDWITHNYVVLDNQIGDMWIGPTVACGTRDQDQGQDTLLVDRLIVPFSKLLHAALLLLTQEQMGICEGTFVSHCVWEAVYSLEGWEWYPNGYMGCKGPMTREGTSRAEALIREWTQNCVFTYMLYQISSFLLGFAELIRLSTMAPTHVWPICI